MIEGCQQEFYTITSRKGELECGIDRQTNCRERERERKREKERERCRKTDTEKRDEHKYMGRRAEESLEDKMSQREGRLR